MYVCMYVCKSRRNLFKIPKNLEKISTKIENLDKISKNSQKSLVGPDTAVSYNRILPLTNYCKSEEVLFKSDTNCELQVKSSNINAEDKQICIKVSTFFIGRILCFRY